MKNLVLFCIFCFLFVLGCDKPTENTIVEKDKYFSVKGKIYFEGSPVKGVEVSLESKTCLSDSNGYFQFDSVKAGQSLLSLSHQKYRNPDTLIKIDSELNLNIPLTLRSDSYYPLHIGNKWFYKEISSDYELSVSIIDTLQIENETYYTIVYAEFAPHFTDTAKHTYLRHVKNDTLYEYSCNGKQILAPFKIGIGQNFISTRCSNNGSKTYEASLNEVENDIKKFYYRLVNTLDGDKNKQFQRGIGMIEYISSPWTCYRLTEYEIKY